MARPPKASVCLLVACHDGMFLTCAGVTGTSDQQLQLTGNINRCMWHAGGHPVSFDCTYRYTVALAVDSISKSEQSNMLTCRQGLLMHVRECAVQIWSHVPKGQLAWKQTGTRASKVS